MKKKSIKMSLLNNCYISQDIFVRHLLVQRNKDLWNRTVIALTWNNKNTPSALLSVANYQPAGIEFNFKFVSVMSMITALQLAADENDANNVMEPITCQPNICQRDLIESTEDILTVFTKTAEGYHKVWYDVSDVWHAMYPGATTHTEKQEMLTNYATISPDFWNGKYPSVQFIEVFDMQSKILSYQAVMTADDMYRFIMSAYIQNKSILRNFVFENEPSIASINNVPSIELSVKQRLDAGETLMSIASDSNCFVFVANNFIFLQNYVQHKQECQHEPKRRKAT